MDIKRLLTRGGQPFAAEIVDGTENYKVFLESIGNTVILPELIKSGWKLTGLPLQLSKNGVALEKLPMMEYSPSPVEEQDMYDLMGTEMPMEDRRKLLSTAEVTVDQTATGSYTIHTREDFLKYLRQFSSTKSETDFLPVNYFVHPHALFSLDEYQDPANREYIALLEQRRRLSYAQYTNFCRWALRNGLPADFSPVDFVSFYFQWGICGLRTQVLSRRTVESYVMRDVVHAAPERRRTFVNDFGLIDRFQREYRRPGTERYENTDSQESLRRSRLLRENQATAVSIRTPAGEMIQEWETLDTNITVSTRYVMVGEMRLTSVSVKGLHGDLHPRFWNPNMSEAAADDMYLHALAEEFIERRRVKVDVSSYRALCECGCSPYSALVYMKDALELDKVDPLATDEAAVIVTTQDIYNYLRGETVQPEVASMIESLMDGSQNIDAVASGLAADAAQSADSIYAQLYCVHHILSIPVSEIHAAIDKFTIGETLSFTNGEIRVDLPSDRIDAAYRGFKADKAAYRKAQCSTAARLVWVDTIARELGPEGADRHVGVRCYTVDASKVPVRNLLDTLRCDFLKRVEDVIADPRTRDAYADCADIHAAGAYFSVALRGYYTFPKELGGDMVNVDADLRANLRKYVVGPVAEDTVSISDSMVCPGFPGEWTTYVTNAIIQPTRVTPRLNYVLRETSLVSVWFSYEGTPTYDELLSRRLINRGDAVWSMLPPIFFTRDQSCSLAAYYRHAQSCLAAYDQSCKFTGVPHLLNAFYPGLPVEDEDISIPAGEGEVFAFKAGRGRTIKYEEEDLAERETTHAPVYKLHDLSAEDFRWTRGKVSLPSATSRKPIMVMNGNTIVMDGREIRPADVETMDPNMYPVAHMYGRKYVLCDMAGVHWVVEV